MKYKYLIVDDEPLARKLIAAHAMKIDGLELVAECGDAVQAANVLRSKQVDLIFLDIQMPEVTGLQLASTLKNPPAIILTTAFRDFAPEAFELDVVDYLLKPISFERLSKAVNKFFERQAPTGNVVWKESEGAGDFVYLKADRKIHKVFAADILFFESLDDYVKVHLTDKVLITRENISALESRLSSSTFIRTHRSFIVNSNWVKTISNEGIEIAGRQLPFGRVFKRTALNFLSVKLP